MTKRTHRCPFCDRGLRHAAAVEVWFDREWVRRHFIQVSEEFEADLFKEEPVMGEVSVNIKGYRQLSEEEQARINQIKDLAERVGSEMNFRHIDGAEPPDARWLEIAKDHLQLGFMAWIRAIAKPETF